MSPKAVWEQARSELTGLPDGRGLNIAYEAVDRHVAHGQGDRTAVRTIGADGAVTSVSYAELKALTNRFANTLEQLGVQPNETVFSLLGRGLETYVTALGTLKHASVFCPLFSAFGPAPIRDRMLRGRARVLVTTADLYQRRIMGIRAELPDLKHVLLVDDDIEGTLSYPQLLRHATDDYVIPATDPETPALLHFTSGTTGLPKGAVHVHDAVVAHHATAAIALGLGPDDVFWCTADPGWVTGTSYGIIAPLTRGATVVTDVGDFDARRWCRTLEEQRVTVWYTAPTALRMFMRAGSGVVRGFDLSHLRHIASVGEPLNAEAVTWAQEAFQAPVHDTWWQTETGAIMVHNPVGVPTRAGAMGLALPGIEVAVLEREAGHVLVTDSGVREAPTGVTGELALRAGWPSMFRGYLGDEERYRKRFIDGWYLTGDLVRRDDEDYIWFVGRGDDVIKSAGHLIGPFEIESLLMQHPAVAEVGVIGKPDPVAGELVKAFVTLRDGQEPTEELRRELVAFGRRRLGVVAPREIDFDQDLPHTRSGKVMRRLLKARELGLPEGDLSTLEPPS